MSWGVEHDQRPGGPDGGNRLCIAQTQCIEKAAINNDLSKEMTVMKTHAHRKQDVEAGLEWESASDAAQIGLAVKYGVVEANG